LLDGWLLTRYNVVEAVLKDRRFVVGESKIERMLDLCSPDQRVELEPFHEMLTRWALYSDGPAHARIRCSFARAFVPQVVSPLSSEVRRIAGELLDAAVAKGTFDLMRDFAVPLPVRVIGTLLGVPEKDTELLKEWSESLGQFLGRPERTFPIWLEAQRAALAMAEYFRPLVEERRAQTGAVALGASGARDLLGMLASAGGSSALSTDEILANAVLLLVAGHETTTNLIGNGVRAMLSTPGAWEACVRGDVDYERATEELLRFDSPVQLGMRVPDEDVVLGGQLVRAGVKVFALLGSANRDPLAFDDPDRLDFGRAPARKALSFGQGAHFCPGAALSRLEGAIAFEELAKRCPTLARVSGSSITWRSNLALRGFDSLVVTCDR
jgi:cytochrome P450